MFTIKNRFRDEQKECYTDEVICSMQVSVDVGS